MNCESVQLTYKPSKAFGGKSLDRMIRCTAEATTARPVGRKSEKETRFCAPCAASFDAFCNRLNAMVLQARRERGEICGEYGATDPYAIKPGDVCARWVYTEPEDAEGVFEVVTKPESRRIERGGRLDDDRPYTWMEELHGRNVWQLQGRLIESGREGWIFYRGYETFWRKEERPAP